MTLDIDVPTPPDVTNRGVPDAIDAAEVPGSEMTLRREEIEQALRDGAWREGFEQWAGFTDLTEGDVRRADEAELFRSFDFYWDPTEERLRYVTPAVPTDWDDRVDGGTSGTILQSELDDLGRTVAETIVEDYVDLGDGEPVDLVWSVETFGQIQPGEEE